LKKNFQVVLERGLFLLIDPESQQAITDPNLLNQIAFRSWPGKPFYVQLEVDEPSNLSVKSIQDINIHIDTQEDSNGI
jgi:hypothetical protein